MTERSYSIVPDDLLALLRKKPANRKPASKSAVDVDLSTHNKKAEKKIKEVGLFATCTARSN